MQIRCSKSSCMEKENRLYSISLGVASFAGWFGRCRNCFISCNVQAISSFLVHHFLSDWSELNATQQLHRTFQQFHPLALLVLSKLCCRPLWKEQHDNHRSHHYSRNRNGRVQE